MDQTAEKEFKSVVNAFDEEEKALALMVYDTDSLLNELKRRAKETETRLRANGLIASGKIKLEKIEELINGNK